MNKKIVTSMMLGLMCATPYINAAANSEISPFPGNGENGIYVFNDQMPMSQIQATIDKIYGDPQNEINGQRVNQFGKQRYAFLFMPGHYQLDVKVGYYTQVLGLGSSPDDVEITGAIRTQDRTPGDPHHPDWGPGALDNFWRSVENISVIPTLGSIKWSNVPKNQNVWAVSQAAPMRRVHIKGDLRLFDIGYSSGGYLADSIVDGTIISGSQQQWLTRNSQWQKWDGSNWNMVFMGSNGSPDNSHGTEANTVVNNTPLIAEKPYLIYENDQYQVVVPALSKNIKGTDWQAINQTSKKIPLAQFYIAHPTDPADTINQQLAQGKNIFFTPGFYQLDKSLQVTQPDTILLGIGLTTLHPSTDQAVISVGDLDGVRIAGLMLDAGTKAPTESLMQIGDSNSTLDHSQDPTIIYDLFCRVGGTGELGTAKSCLTINSNNVIGDNLWLWRADHGANVGWTINQSDTGLIVNGSDVSIYGLAVEHFQKNQTIWNGENGKVVFYQSELPYDVPQQSAWQDNGKLGYASYKVAPNVSTHQAIGLGIYNYFNVGDNIYAENAIEAPSSDAISFQNMITVWLNGHANTGIKHIINGNGDSVSPEKRTARLSK